MATIYNPAFKADAVITQVFSSTHLGFDSSSAWGATAGHPIYAMERGKVVESNLVYGKYGWINTSGNYVAVQHPGTPTHYFVTTGKHLNSRSVVVGDSVTGDTQVGTEGKTGGPLVTGVHLHQDVFEYNNGTLKRIDPRPFIENPKLLIVEEEEVVSFPVYAKYEALNTLKTRVAPSRGADVIKDEGVKAGTPFTAVKIAENDEHMWALHADGWSALGTLNGSDTWVKAVVVSDDSEHVKDLVAKLAVEKSKTSSLTADVADQRSHMDIARAELE